MSGPRPDLASALAAAARRLSSAGDEQATLDEIVRLAVETIDGCDHAGIAVIGSHVVATPAATDDVPRTVDAIQYETNQGPCLDAIRERETFQTDSLSNETRWPAFAHRAALETGVESMLTFRLFVESNTLGALNLYSRKRAAFDDEARYAGALFAAHASIALSSAQHVTQIGTALRSRDVIGQAKGIIMEHEGLDEEEAFAVLRQASQRLNLKLRDVASRVAETRDMP